MKFNQLAVLLPCTSLENFDLQRSEHDSGQVLAAWSALWHPLLVSAVGRIPRWLPAAAPPDPAGHLVVVPDCCEASLPEGWLEHAESVDACVLRRMTGRDEVLTAALQQIAADPAKVDSELAADFLALGYCHLQVELLTRKLRYMSNLDETAMQTAVVAAADEALKGDVTAAREQLQAAFDRLYEAREYFYPSDAQLLDLTLVAQTTLGPALQAELSGTLPRNILLSGELLAELSHREPATVEALKLALAGNLAAVVGGEFAEAPLPLIEPEAIEHQLRVGLAAYRKHLEWRPTVFGRRHFGLTPALPQILARSGFTAAIHCTLDDGRFPTSSQSRIQWEGMDGTTIDAIGCVPIDAGKANSFLRLAETLGNAMNLDPSATVVFAHWSGRASPWYDDLRRIATYGSIFGTFSTIGDYFEHTANSGQRNTYGPDEYRPPYLRQDVAASRRDPISRWIRYFRRRASITALQTLNALSMMCSTAVATGERSGATNDNPETQASSDVDQLVIAVEDSLSADDLRSALDVALAESLQESLVRFAKSVVGPSPSQRSGRLLVNPWNASQQGSLQSVDVPAMGFAWVSTNPEPSPLPTKRTGWFRSREPKEAPPLAEGNVLRNEFFEITFDPLTGAIRAVSDYRSRDPRLAQQIALREPRGSDPETDANYSRMAADELRVVAATPLLGEMLSRGRLLDHDGRRVAGFRQTTRVRRGSRVIELEIDLETDREPGPNPWNSYYAARIAWKNETAKLHRSVNMAVVPTELKQFESPFSCRHLPRCAAYYAVCRRVALSSPHRTTAARYVVGHARRDRAHVSPGNCNRRTQSHVGCDRVHGSAVDNF